MDLKPSLRQAIDHYLQDRRSCGLTAGTLQQDRTKSKMFLEWCLEVGYDSLDAFAYDTFSDYVAYLYSRPSNRNPNKGLEKSSITKHIDFLITFGRFLHEEGYTTEDYSQRLKRPKIEERVIRAFTDEQIRVIFKTLKRVRSSRKSRAQTAILLYLLLDTGLRISEALNLRPVDIDFDHRLLTVWGKGEKERKVPFSVKTSTLLTHLITARNIARNEYIWRTVRSNRPITGVSIRSALRTIQRLAGSEAGLDSVPVRPHVFRHTFAKRWIMANGDVLTLQKILGHASLQMTQKYVYLWGTDLVEKHDATMQDLDVDLEIVEFL